jgi:hypothetical protein
MPMRVKGLDQLQKQIEAEAKRVEDEVVQTRRKAAEVVTEAIASNVPVWSGRTLESVGWTNSGQGPRARGHPDRGGFATEGPFKSHPEFGFTSRMALGAEPRRGAAEQTIRGSLASVNFDMKSRVVLRSNAGQWDEIDQAQLPSPVGARNIAVVSEIAQATAVSRVPGVKQRR